MGLFAGLERRYDKISSLRLGFYDEIRFVFETFIAHCVSGALARGSRELGQDLIVAAISEVLLCEGL